MLRPTTIAALLLLTSAPVLAQEPPAGDWKKTAERMQKSIVTVRIRRAETPVVESHQVEGQEAAKEKPPEASVTVCTGFCVGPRTVVTAALASTDDRIRLTLAGGAQCDARLLVVDEYSGLSLLGCEGKELTPLPLAAEQPAVGEYVMAGAAWGVDRPIVSLGIIGATERTLAGLLMPPLLQCDLRTVETSSGSPLANRQSEVVGVVMAVEEPDAQRGWTYAVPITHIRRLIRTVESTANAQTSKDPKNPSVVVLKRRRPIVGMVLEGQDEAVVVQRITAGGPAEKAGLKVGDRIVTTDGVAIRSVYEAVRPTMYKQPGDIVRYHVVRVQTDKQTEHDCEVILGGGVELPRLSHNDLGQLFRPRVEVGRRDGQYFAQSGRGHLREVSAEPLSSEEKDPQAPPTAEQKIDLLMKSLERYQKVIEIQQREINSLKEEMKKK